MTTRSFNTLYPAPGAVVLPRPGSNFMHRFRSTVRHLAVIGGRLTAITDRGVYRLDRNGKRWRRVTIK